MRSPTCPICRGQAERLDELTPSQQPHWEASVRAANRLMDLVCAMYHPGDARARAIAPTATWAEIIQEEILR